MDINDVRIIITVVSFATFIGIILWAWSSRQRDGFDTAARQPLQDDDSPVAVPVSKIRHRNAFIGSRE